MKCFLCGNKKIHIFALVFFTIERGKILRLNKIFLRNTLQETTKTKSQKQQQTKVSNLRKNQQKMSGISHKKIYK